MKVSWGYALQQGRIRGLCFYRPRRAGGATGRTVDNVRSEHTKGKPYSLYTAEALSVGDARNGQAYLADRSSDLKMSVPKEMGGAGDGINPE